MLRAVLFDLDAALIRVSDVSWSRFARYLADCGSPERDPHEIIKLIEPIWRKYYMRIVRLELTRRNEATFWREMVEEALEVLEADCSIRRLLADWPHFRFLEPQPGAHTLLTRLKMLGYRTAVYANTGPSLRRCLDYHGFGRLVDHAFPCNEVGYIKPDGRGYRMVAKLMGVEPGEIVYFDDDEYNVRSARAGGYRAYLVRPGRPGPEIVADHQQMFEILRR